MAIVNLPFSIEITSLSFIILMSYILINVVSFISLLSIYVSSTFFDASSFASFPSSSISNVYVLSRAFSLSNVTFLSSVSNTLFSITAYVPLFSLTTYVFAI